MMYSELSEQYNSAFDMLSKDKWRKLSVAEKIIVLQKIENFSAMQSNRPPAIVKIEENMPKARNGYYNTDDNTIVQNVRCIKAKSSDIAVKNLLHEGRHAYQYDCVHHPERHREISDYTIEEWSNNFDNYKAPKKNVDYQLYYMQPLEIDARSYANSNYESYLNKNVLLQNINQILSQEVNYMWKGHKKGQEQGNQEQSQISSKSQTESYKESLRVTPEQQEVNKKWNTEHQKQSSSSSSSSPDSKDRADSLDQPKKQSYSRGR